MTSEIVKLRRLVSQQIPELLKSKSGKSDSFWVDQRELKSQFDLRADGLVRKLIRQISSSPIYSEEVFFEKPEENETYWVIDPLDGTYNFTQFEKWYATSIAFVSNGIIEEGIILDDLGCLRAEPDREKNSASLTEASDLLFTGIPARVALDDNFFLKASRLQRKFRKVRMIGCASLSICYAIEMRATYCEFGIAFWDVAAGVALAKKNQMVIKMEERNWPLYDVLITTPAVMNSLAEIFDGT